MNSDLAATPPIRGTQKLVDQMGWVFSHPGLVAVEISWRWLFGVPFLFACWTAARRIAQNLPPDSTGLTSIDPHNPWVAAAQLTNVWARYQPAVSADLMWLLPVAALAWIVLSGFGRSYLLTRLEPGLPLRPIKMMALQAVWLGLFSLVLGSWFKLMSWVAATHIAREGEADLIGFSIWAIFLTLAFFTLWALVNWPIAVAPVLMLFEKRSVLPSIAESLKLGRSFTGKLVETNLVMGIVKLALIVLAMVFSAAPLPFSDELGSESLHAIAAAALVFYFVASDYFHVVKLKGLVEFWRTYRTESSITR